MAISTAARFEARRAARFHVQVEIEDAPLGFDTPAMVSVTGRVVRSFRGSESLRVGDRVSFAISVCRAGDQIPPGHAFAVYEDFVSARHVEVYLNGAPPRCDVPADEWMFLHEPSERPQLNEDDVSAAAKTPWRSPRSFLKRLWGTKP